MTKPWEATVPKPPKQKHVKRCYTIWQVWRWGDSEGVSRAGGKVVWLTDAQLTFARIKYPKKEFRHVLEKDLLEEYKKYIGQTIE
jgi:hypothetical protein